MKSDEILKRYNRLMKMSQRYTREISAERNRVRAFILPEKNGKLDPNS